MLTSDSVAGNRLTSIEGLDTLTSLEELYLSHNGLTRVEGLSKLVSLFVIPRSEEIVAATLTCLDVQTSLTTLDIGHNKITELEPESLSTLTELEELWVSLSSRSTCAPR